jgi:hypothetical protein
MQKVTQSFRSSTNPETGVFRIRDTNGQPRKGGGRLLSYLVTGDVINQQHRMCTIDVVADHLASDCLPTNVPHLYGSKMKSLYA